MRIFLTHIAEEAGLAAVLKGWIERAFPDDCQVFVSSDKENIRLGDKWLNKIDQALDDASLFLVLCSPRSVHRPWVNFETGCGWIKRVPVIPICHSGQAIAELPLPLSALQGIETRQANFAEKLLDAIGERASNVDVAPVDFEQMTTEVRDAEQADVATSDTPEPSATASAASDVTKIEMKLLESLIDNPNTWDKLAKSLGLHELAVRFHLDELELRQMVWAGKTVSSHIPNRYGLLPEGRRVLIHAGLLK